MITFFTCGGTIDKIYFDREGQFQIGEPGISGILHEGNVTVEYRVEEILKKDSLEMTDEDREVIYQRVSAEPCPRIVLTHGTDTMKETALFLRSIEGKTIVLTGAMQPARFQASDAKFNVGGAIVAVQALPPGVYIVMNGQVFHPDEICKNRGKQCFEKIVAR